MSILEEKNRKKVGFLGPKGTFTEEALTKYLGEISNHCLPYPSIEEVLIAVDKEEVELGFVPIENSVEGSVNITLDMLIGEVELTILGEISIPIRHNLLIQKGAKIENIKKVYSHPQAIAQCRHFLKKTLPTAQIQYTESTAEAALKVAEARCVSTAAIGTIKGANNNNLEVILTDIQDYEDNTTRFILLGKKKLSSEEYSPFKKYKTSLVFRLRDTVGALYEVMKVLNEHNINMKKIESRPAKNLLGEYIFLVDIEGHQNESSVKKALNLIKPRTLYLKILGSYENS